MKLFLKLFTALIILIAFGTFAVLQYISLNTFKEEIQSYISQEYDIKVQFDEDITHSLYKPGTITFERLSVHLDKKKILETKLKVDLKVMKMLKGDFGVDQLHFHQAKTNINQSDIDLLLKKISSKDQPQAKTSKTKFAIHDFAVKNSHIQYDQFNLIDFNLAAKMNQDQLTIRSLKAKTFEADLNLEGQISYSDGNVINLKGELNNIPLEQWNDILKEYKYSTKGKVNLNFDLTQKQRLNANILIKSDSIIINGMNLNRLLDGFIDSREVGILDIASYVTLGPVGAIVTNTLEASKSYPGLGRGETQIQQAYFKFKVDDQTIETEDVALKTSEYRLAAIGKLNLKDKVYEDFRIHILNKKGCSRIFQELKGSLTSPEVGATKTFAKGVIGPLTDLFSRVKGVVKKCEPVYEGEVSPP